MSMPAFECKFATLEVGKKRRPTLEKAAFHLTFAKCEGTTVFTTGTGTSVDFDSKTNTPLYKSACGTKTVTTLLSDNKSQMRWVMVGNEGNSIMATDWRAVPLMAYDICPHCVFSCPCLCGAMEWKSETASYTLTATHASAETKEVTENHMQDALTMRYGLYQAMEYSLIENDAHKLTKKQVATMKATARNKSSQMFLNHTASYKHLMVRRRAAASFASAFAAEASATTAGLLDRINDSTTRIKTEAARVAMQIQKIGKAEWSCVNADDRARDDNFIMWATQRLKAVYDVLFGSDYIPSVSEEYNDILHDCISKINDARGYVAAAMRHRKTVSDADAATAAATILESVEAAVVAEVTGGAAVTLQARVRTCLLFRRIEDVRRAAALLASTRYELRTLARLRNDEECGICLSRFDYHVKSPLTAPCSNMPLCYACCRDYAGKVCLCGIDHFDRKLWRAAV